MVRAISNKFGSESTQQTATWIRTSVRRDNGQISSSSGSTQHRKDVHIRAKKSRNDPVHIPGVGPFRPPSDYIRHMVNLVQMKPQETTLIDTNFTTYTSGFPVSTLADYVQLWTFPVNENGVYQTNWERDQSVTECLARLNAGKVEVGAFLGEAITSANQIADLGGSIFRDLLRIKRRLFKIDPNLWRASKSIADGYLGYKYGVKPLASDLYSMAQEWNSNGLAQKGLIVSASRNVIGRHSRTQDSGKWRNRQQNTVHLAQTKLFGLVNSQFKARARHIGLANPATIAWELTPYSFVLDWALPVGTYLEALGASVGLDFLAGYSMTRTSTRVRGEFLQNPANVGVNAYYEYEALSMERKKYSSFPTPVLYAKNPFSTGNVLSALALFRQLFK